MSDSYVVLARKYRPMTFDDLVGQDVLVETVSNAIKAGRIPHAYLLTGIRGIGKTTSARIIAKTLNCIGEDGKNETIPLKPCGKCPHCRAIMEGNDVDVVEMDAASNRGIGDIRELIDGIKYTPMSSRYKVYIIDEVHMLTTEAFNALLKTLEEPPEHTKFILATTEVKKVPITILSRCQRFDLKRLSFEMMAKHLGTVAEKEGVTITPQALNVLATVSEGSARDGLSLLDQAIARSGKNITEDDVKQMLGLADRSETVSLFYEIMSGNAANALKNVEMQYENGVGAVAVIRDLLEITHLVTRIKIGAGIEEILYSDGFITKIKEYAQSLNMASLTLVWQMLVNGATEVSVSPFPMKSLEMLLVRICYATGIPDFRELLKKNSRIDETNVTADIRPIASSVLPVVQTNIVGVLPSKKEPIPEQKRKDEQEIGDVAFDVFRIYKLAQEKDIKLAYDIYSGLCLSKVDGTHLVIADSSERSKYFVSILPRKLKEWTGVEWTAELVNDPNHRVKTIKENNDLTQNYFSKKVMDDPLIKKIYASLDCYGISKVEPAFVEDEDQKDETLYNLGKADAGLDTNDSAD